MTTKPVSYTHLDVYKRQEQQSTNNYVDHTYTTITTCLRINGELKPLRPAVWTCGYVLQQDFTSMCTTLISDHEGMCTPYEGTLSSLLSRLQHNNVGANLPTSYPPPPPPSPCVITSIYPILMHRVTERALKAH